jgi:hypothetical protein
VVGAFQLGQWHRRALHQLFPNSHSRWTCCSFFKNRSRERFCVFSPYFSFTCGIQILRPEPRPWTPAADPSSRLRPWS